MLARPTSFERSTLSELWRVENFRCSDGSGMLIGDPLGEGSNASSTNSELWRAEKSSFRMMLRPARFKSQHERGITQNVQSIECLLI